MKSSGFACLLSLMPGLAWGLDPQGSASPGPDQAVSLVSSLYTEEVARRPLGIPFGSDLEAFRPYLSKSLLHRFDLRIACDRDWLQQNPDPHLKPPGLIENGVFSGANEQAKPQTFRIEKAESKKNFSTRVYVRLTVGAYVWHVAAVVVREAGHPVVDDVLYLKDKNGAVEGRLTKYLSSGCNGPHWVGYPDRG